MKEKFLLRGLATTIDFFLIFLPSYMLLTVMEISGFLFMVLPQLLFVVYNIVSITSFNGKTIGKYFSRLSVYTEDEGALHLGIREVAKLLYFLPNIGILFLLASTILGLVFNQPLHDWIGKSQVLLDKERKQLEKENNHEKQFAR